MKEARIQETTHQKNVTQEKWIKLIDGKWRDEDWLVINTLKILIISEVCSHLSPR